MNNQLLNQVVKFAKTVGYVLLATADKKGIPHIATAGELQYDIDQNLIKVTQWFCSKTVANLQVNNYIAIAVWQPEIDKGYQLQGSLEEVRNISILDGYSVKETQELFPQIRKELLVKIEEVTEFCHAVHSDENLLGQQKEVGS